MGHFGAEAEEQERERRAAGINVWPRHFLGFSHDFRSSDGFLMVFSTPSFIPLLSTLYSLLLSEVLSFFSDLELRVSVEGADTFPEKSSSHGNEKGWKKGYTKVMQRKQWLLHLHLITKSEQGLMMIDVCVVFWQQELTTWDRCVYGFAMSWLSFSDMIFWRKTLSTQNERLSAWSIEQPRVHRSSAGWDHSEVSLQFYFLTSEV